MGRLLADRMVRSHNPGYDAHPLISFIGAPQDVAVHKIGPVDIVVVVRFTHRRGVPRCPSVIPEKFDLFIKKGNRILVIEIKGDEEISEPADENKSKYRYARQHFETLNQQQAECTYFFHFLTPRDYDKFFKFLRDENYASFVSELDAALEGNEESS